MKKLKSIDLDRIKPLVDEVGRVKGNLDRAAAEYKKVRAKVKKVFEKKVGEDVWVVGSKHKVALLRENTSFIDPIDLLKYVKASTKRRRVLRVIVAEVKKCVSKKVFNAIFHSIPALEPRLYVVKLSSKGKNSERSTKVR